MINFQTQSQSPPGPTPTPTPPGPDYQCSKLIKEADQFKGTYYYTKCQSAFPDDSQLHQFISCLHCIDVRDCKDVTNQFVRVISTLASGLLLFFTGFYLLYHKKFAKHPYKLLAYTCLAEALTFLYICSRSFVCLTEYNPSDFVGKCVAIWIVLSEKGWSEGWQILTDEDIWQKSRYHYYANISDRLKHWLSF